MDIVQKLSESCFCEGRGCDLCEATREILKLRESLVDSGSALLACEMRLNAALARAREPNCLTCAQFNQGVCLLRLYHGVMCAEGDHYAEVKPMRLYERSGEDSAAVSEMLAARRAEGEQGG